ncbi:hypothetical protein MAR_031548 [Mya arenaria]|uniref:THAP-type domain-containing protein n=1 Tax=Mya arenaria TaxID=6604 RepID=A0ABY7F858_MYAAR|nr:hypothetical protein MAR_031548 [Mya arenaria]
MENNENLPPNKTLRKRASSGGKRYCALCHHYENQILDDDFRVTLHRIPGGQSKHEVSRRKAWLRGIKLHRPNLNVNDNTRICSLPFENRQCVRSESVPKYYNLGKTKVNLDSRLRRPLFKQPEREIFFARKIENYCLPETFEDSLENCATIEVEDTKLCYREEAIQINACEHGYSKNREFATTEESSTQTDTSQTSGGYKPENIIAGNDGNTRFYTGFPTYAVFMLFFQTFIKHGADRLTYWEGQKRTLQDKSQKELPSKPGRKRKLRPIDEFFMVCVRLRLGLLQQHLADLFCVSTMTVSRVMSTWINFMYDHMKGLIPWPTKEQILTNLPKCFQEISDSRIVIDATEFFCNPGVDNL